MITKKIYKQICITAICWCRKCEKGAQNDTRTRLNKPIKVRKEIYKLF